MKTALILDVPEDHALVPMVRQIGRTLLQHHWVLAADIDEIEVILGELCSNVTVHAHSALGFYHVCLEHHGETVTITVTDYGCGLGPSAAPPMGTVRDGLDGAERFGGFGLPLIRTLADHVEFRSVHPTGTTVIAQKRVRTSRVSGLSGGAASAL